VISLSTRSRSLSASKVAIATELPNGSCSQRSAGFGVIFRVALTSRRSWLSRGRTSRRCSAKRTGCL
jgi:hypothetical protein